jgi:hypothetical protein
MIEKQTINTAKLTATKMAVIFLPRNQKNE